MGNESDRQPAERASQERTPRGIFMADGTELTLRNIRIDFSADDGVASNVEVVVRLDLCRHWLGIAFEHLLDARAAHGELVAVAASEDSREGTSLHDALVREFRSSMQALVAAAVALDALYAAVQQRSDIPVNVTQAWKDNRTARWRRIAETLRLGIEINDEEFQALRDILRQLDKYRGWAVHPPAKQKQAVLRDEIQRGVEWRFVAFRYENALTAVEGAIAIVYRLIEEKRARSDPLKKYAKGLRESVEKLVAQWKAEFPEDVDPEGAGEGAAPEG